MMKLACIVLLAACVQAKDFKIIFENIGAISGLSVYFTGIKEGPGSEIPGSHDSSHHDLPPGLETFQNFLEVGDKAGLVGNLGSRYVVRGRDSKAGPGFRAAIQIQNGRSGVPYKIVFTAIGAAEVTYANVELVHRGEFDEKEYAWIEPGRSVGHFTQGNEPNAFELRNGNNTAQIKITLFEIDHDEL